jgi:hypothetical protein
LNTSIDQKKRVTAENYRLLTTSLSELRSKKTLELEARHSEIESLVEAIDRSTRLNEREKAEIADEVSLSSLPFPPPPLSDLAPLCAVVAS